MLTKMYISISVKLSLKFQRNREFKGTFIHMNIKLSFKLFIKNNFLLFHLSVEIFVCFSEYYKKLRKRNANVQLNKISVMMFNWLY